MKKLTFAGIIAIVCGTCFGLSAKHDNAAALSQLDLAKAVNAPPLKSMASPAVPTPQMMQTTLFSHGHQGITTATQIGSTEVCVPQYNANTAGVVETWATCSGVTIKPGSGWWFSLGTPMSVIATFNVPSGAQYAVVNVGGAVVQNQSPNVMASKNCALKPS